MAVRIVGKTGSDVSFACFPVAKKGGLCCGPGCFMVWKRMFCGVEKAVLRCGKGSFGLRKRLFGTAERAFPGGDRAETGGRLRVRR